MAISSAPALSRDFSEQDKLDIARKLTALLPALQVSYTGSPVILNDNDPIVFRITPSGKSSFGKLFLAGRYDIIHRPDDAFNLGSYLCHLGQEFVRTRRAQNSSFLLPKFDVGISLKYEDIGFEISGDQDTLAQLIYGILYLWDAAAEADYGHFEILVRGSADEGGEFVGTMLDYHPINKVTFLPSALPDPLLFYERTPKEANVGQQFGNADLPNLRATYVKQIIDGFLEACKVRGSLAESSYVLNGAVFSGQNSDYRSIEIFFYAYH